MERALLEADERGGAEEVVVLGYDFWKNKLDGAADAVGRVIRISGVRLQPRMGTSADSFAAEAAPATGAGEAPVPSFSGSLTACKRIGRDERAVRRG